MIEKLYLLFTSQVLLLTLNIMRALVYDKELRYLTDYPVPKPSRDEALIRVTHAGDR